MNKCVECLMNNGYNLYLEEDDIHILFKKIIDNNEFMLLLIGPHSGNDYHYILRGDFVEEHDRWSNASYQKEFFDEDDFIKNWNKFWFWEDVE